MTHFEQNVSTTFLNSLLVSDQHTTISIKFQKRSYTFANFRFPIPPPKIVFIIQYQPGNVLHLSYYDKSQAHFAPQVTLQMFYSD